LKDVKTTKITSRKKELRRQAVDGNSSSCVWNNRPHPQETGISSQESPNSSEEKRRRVKKGASEITIITPLITKYNVIMLFCSELDGIVFSRKKSRAGRGFSSYLILTSHRSLIGLKWRFALKQLESPSASPRS